MATSTQSRKAARLVQELRAVAVEEGCFEGPYGLLLETPVGRTSVHIYDTSILGMFLNPDMQAWKYLAEVSKNGKWGHYGDAVAPDSLRYRLRRFKAVVVPPARSWEEFLALRPQLAPLIPDLTTPSVDADDVAKLVRAVQALLPSPTVPCQLCTTVAGHDLTCPLYAVEQALRPFGA